MVNFDMGEDLMSNTLHFIRAAITFLPEIFSHLQIQSRIFHIITMGGRYPAIRTSPISQRVRETGGEEVESGYPQEVMGQTLAEPKSVAGR